MKTQPHLAMNSVKNYGTYIPVTLAMIGRLPILILLVRISMVILLYELVTNRSYLVVFQKCQRRMQNLQKQPPRGVLLKSCSQKFHKIHSKTPVQESLSLKNFIKKDTLVQVFSCEFCEIFRITFSYRTSLVAASEPAQPFEIVS